MSASMMPIVQTLLFVSMPNVKIRVNQQEPVDETRYVVLLITKPLAVAQQILEEILKSRVSKQNVQKIMNAFTLNLVSIINVLTLVHCQIPAAKTLNVYQKIILLCALVILALLEIHYWVVFLLNTVVSIPNVLRAPNVSTESVAVSFI